MATQPGAQGEFHRPQDQQSTQPPAESQKEISPATTKTAAAAIFPVRHAVRKGSHGYVA